MCPACCVARCSQFSFQDRYVGLSCDLMRTVLLVSFMGIMSLVLFLVSLLQFVYKNVCVML